MKTLPAALETQAVAEEQAPILLAEISSWGGETVRIANADADITYGGEVYDARLFGVGNFGPAQGTAARSIVLAVANQDLAWSILCAANEPRGSALKLIRVFLDDLTVAEPLSAYLKIVDYRVTETAVKFRCIGMGDLFNLSIPRRKHNRTCSWVFKGTECGYAGGANFCSVTDPVNGPHEYTDAACRSLENFENYGGHLHVFPARK